MACSFFIQSSLNEQIFAKFFRIFFGFRALFSLISEEGGRTQILIYIYIYTIIINIFIYTVT